MEWVETTGRTVEEAKDRALDQLGVDEPDAEFEIVDEPKPGLFGRVRGEARVRARVRPTRPRPKAERRDRRRRAKVDGDGELDVSDDAASERESDGEEAWTAPEAAERSGDRDPEDDEAAESGEGDRPAAEAVETTATGRRGRAPAGSDAASAQGPAAGEFLEGLASAFGLHGTTEVISLEEGDLEVRLHGEDLGLLIGPRGQTLQAIQDLTRLAVQRHDDDRHSRLRIDIAGYRERRREALARFTQQVANQVVASGQSRALEPMSAADRKVVHDVVNTLAGVATRSEGEEPFRRVVILPADA